MLLMSVTLLVSNDDKSGLVNPRHISNIPLIFVTLLVSNDDKSKLSN